MRSAKHIGYFLVLALAMAVVLPACKKEWKQTTQLDVAFRYTPSTPVSGFTISSLALNLDKIKFSGKRKQGGDVIFESASGSLQYLTPGGFRVLKCDLPQGDYTQILFDLFIDRPDTNPALVVTGVFTDSCGNVKQVCISLSASIYTESLVRNGSGGSEVSVVYGKTSSLWVTLDPGYWLGSVNGEDLNDAESSGQQGSETIYIDKYHNTDLYQAILTRMNVPPVITMP